RVVGEVDLLLLLVPLVHGKVDDPAELEAVLVDELQLASDHGAGLAGELVELRRIAGGEEHRITNLQPELLLDGAGALRSDVPGDGAGAGSAFLLAPEDVAEARLALLLRPAVHAIAERTRAAARRGNRPHARLGVLLDQL